VQTAPRAVDVLADRAAALDAADPLAGARAAFLLPDGVVHLDGNSLGALPAAVPAALAATVREEWGRSLIGSWDAPAGWAPHGWWSAPEAVGELIAPIVGAGPGQVLVTDSTSVDLFTTGSAALGLARARDPQRHQLVTDVDGFPTDRYVLRSLCEQRGLDYVELPVDAVAGHLDDDGPSVALLALSHVDFRTGRLHDLAGLTAAAHRAGALALWDVAHSAGVLPVDLDEHRVDLAVGCGYKWLNGGPGAPAFVYVARRHLVAGLVNPIPGWASAADPFAMAADHIASATIARLRIGTPPILSLRALAAALEVYRGVDLRVVRAVSLSLTGFFLKCLAEVCPALGVATPAAATERASQVSVVVPDAPRVVARLARRGVLADSRPPDLARFGFAPLYTSHADALAGALALAAVVGPAATAGRRGAD